MKKISLLTCLLLNGVLFAYGPQPRLDLNPEPPKTMLQAYTWSTLGTLVPMLAGYTMAQNISDGPVALPGLLFVTGMTFGPSLGQFYAESPSQALLGIGLRAGGGAIAIVGMARALSNMFCDLDESEDRGRSCNENSDGTLLMMGGSLMFLGGFLYSFIDTGRAINRLNARSDESEFGWQPMLIPGKNGDLKTGFSAWAHF
jgi:hypothetical protein